MPVRLIGLGVIVSVAGQFGDLMVSSIKRDIGIKDMSAAIPGHGGLLDRFDSLLLVAPAVFHYVGYSAASGSVSQCGFSAAEVRWKTGNSSPRAISG
ncbi:MAG: phosphatidate cytidylyltransferase [Chthoniobacterales bacterium]